MLQRLATLIYGAGAVTPKRFQQTESCREGGDKEKELANVDSSLPGRLRQEGL